MKGIMKRTHEEKLMYWKPYVLAWHASGQPMTKYCEAHDIPYDQFKYWRARMRVDEDENEELVESSASTVSFVPVETVGIEGKGGELFGVRIHLVDGVSIELNREISVCWLRSLLSVLR